MEIRYYGDKISERIAKTPEGFLICQDVPISRTGYQEYLASELMDNPVNKHKIIPVYRPAKEVFDPRSLASFEGKPVTNEHPDEDVTPENYQRYSCGHVQNVHVGNGEDANKVLADLYITDPTLIRLIEDGKREISCGYYAEEHKDDTGKLCQVKIRGNHVAVVRNGRAGKTVCIRDKHPYKGKSRFNRFSGNNRFTRGGYLQGDERMRYYDDDYLTDEDEILEDDDILLEDEDELLEDDEDVIVEDEDCLEDGDYLEDDEDILEDDDEVIEDEDYLEDEDEFVEDEDYLDTFYKDFGVKGMKKGEHVKARDPEYLASIKGGNGGGQKKGMSTGKKVALGAAAAAGAVGAGLLGRKLGKAIKAEKALAGMMRQNLSTKQAAGRVASKVAGSAKSAARNVANRAANFASPKRKFAHLEEPSLKAKPKSYNHSEFKKKYGNLDSMYRFDSRYFDRYLPYYDDEELILNDEELLEDDDLLLEDEDELLEDDELILEDEDMLEDEDELLEDDEDVVVEDDDEDISAQAADVIRDAKRTLRDARNHLKRLRMRDAIILNDDDIEEVEDDEEELLQDDEDELVKDYGGLHAAKSLYKRATSDSDEELLEDDEDVVVDDDYLEDDEEEFVDDDEELTEDDEDVIVEDEDELTEDGCHHDEEEAIDTDKTKALREIAEASRGITDPTERKQLQDAIYKALCGRNQMQDVMRITKRNVKSRMDSAEKKNTKVDLTQQQSIYDSLNPHKKTSF